MIISLIVRIEAAAQQPAQHLNSTLAHPITLVHPSSWLLLSKLLHSKLPQPPQPTPTHQSGDQHRPTVSSGTKSRKFKYLPHIFFSRTDRHEA